MKNLHHKRGVGQGKIRIAGVLLSLAATGEAVLEHYFGSETKNARTKFTGEFPEAQGYTVDKDLMSGTAPSAPSKVAFSFSRPNQETTEYTITGSWAKKATDVFSIPMGDATNLAQSLGGTAPAAPAPGWGIATSYYKDDVPHTAAPKSAGTTFTFEQSICAFYCELHSSKEDAYTPTEGKSVRAYPKRYTVTVNDSEPIVLSDRNNDSEDEEPCGTDGLSEYRGNGFYIFTSDQSNAIKTITWDGKTPPFPMPKTYLGGLIQWARLPPSPEPTPVFPSAGPADQTKAINEDANRVKALLKIPVELMVEAAGQALGDNFFGAGQLSDGSGGHPASNLLRASNGGGSTPSGSITMSRGDSDFFLATHHPFFLTSVLGDPILEHQDSSGPVAQLMATASPLSTPFSRRGFVGQDLLLRGLLQLV